MAHIELVELARHYRTKTDSVRAVDGISLEIERGELLAVIGRSGSGKTTLLDLVGLLLRPTSGRVVIDGVDTARLSDSRRAQMRGRSIGFVFQEYNLLPTLDVLENVLLPFQYVKPNVREPRRRALDLLELVGLSHRLRHRPDELSGGQQQRVAIARALVNRPAVVLADEPTGAIDSETAEELIRLIQRLNHEESVTFVVVTHDADLAGQTRRIVRLRDGRVVSDGPAAPARSAVAAIAAR